VEYGELDAFFRLKESYDPDVDDDHPAPPAKPVGVPGASSPQQMTNQKPSYAAKPSPLKSKDESKAKEIDVGEVLEETGLQGVKVTDDELADLIKELGLEGDEAGDLVKGLSQTAGAAETPEAVPPAPQNEASASPTDDKSEQNKEGGEVTEKEKESTPQ